MSSAAIRTEAVGSPHAVVRSQQRDEACSDADLWAVYRSTGDRDVRNLLVERHRHLVARHLRRFTGRGISTEDVQQTAMLALLKAVERFDPDVGVAFTTFAGRTIDGELKRMLRDRSWAVRPPRRLQEHYLSVCKAEDHLVQSLGRSPTTRELARATGTSEDQVLQCLEAGGARRAGSFDRPARPEGPTLHGLLGSTDPSFDRAEARVVVRDLLASLERRERTIVELRFFHELDQPEIAARLGLSQSYVSRLIRRVLDTMRRDLAGTVEIQSRPGGDRNVRAASG